MEFKVLSIVADTTHPGFYISGSHYGKHLVISTSEGLLCLRHGGLCDCWCAEAIKAEQEKARQSRKLNEHEIKN